MTQSLLATIATDTLRAILVDMRAKRDHVAVALIQTELFYRQPIVTSQSGYSGWTATRGDYDLDDRIGCGRTEQEAIDDLIEWEEMDRDDEPAFTGLDGMVEERERHP